MTDLVFDDSEQPSKTIWRALRDSVGDLLRVASAADCAKCGVSKKMMKGRDLFVFEPNIWEHDFKIPSPIIEKIRKSNGSTGVVTSLRCFALVDPVTEDTLADPDKYPPRTFNLHHIEEAIGPRNGRRAALVCMCSMVTNQSVETLIKSVDARAVAEALALCASFRPRLALCYRDATAPHHGGSNEIKRAFGGAHADYGGRVFANYLRPASVSELEIAKLTPTEKKQYDSFWVFTDAFFAHGHGQWTSRATILAQKKNTVQCLLTILYAECLVTGIKGRGGSFELHHLSVRSTLRKSRKADFFVGIMHRSANSALKLFNRRARPGPRPR